MASDDVLRRLIEFTGIDDQDRVALADLLERSTHARRTRRHCGAEVSPRKSHDFVLRRVRFRQALAHPGDGSAPRAESSHEIHDAIVP